MTKRERLIEFIDDLLINFDEMGFAPTTAVPDPEAYAIEWKNKLTNALQGYRRQSEGEWVQSKSKFGFGQSNCSQCGGYVDGYTSYRYCPHCGTKIKGVITECAEHLSYTT